MNQVESHRQTASSQTPATQFVIKTTAETGSDVEVTKKEQKAAARCPTGTSVGEAAAEGASNLPAQKGC